MALPAASTSVLVSLIALIILHAFRRRGVKNYPLPPGPPRLPIIGNLLNKPNHSEWETYADWGQKHSRLLKSHTNQADGLFLRFWARLHEFGWYKPRCPQHSPNGYWFIGKAGRYIFFTTAFYYGSWTFGFYMAFRRYAKQRRMACKEATFTTLLQVPRRRLSLYRQCWLEMAAAARDKIHQFSVRKTHQHPWQVYGSHCPVSCPFQIFHL